MIQITDCLAVCEVAAVGPAPTVQGQFRYCSGCRVPDVRVFDVLIIRPLNGPGVKCLIQSLRIHIKRQFLITVEIAGQVMHLIPV